MSKKIRNGTVQMPVRFSQEEAQYIRDILDRLPRSVKFQHIANKAIVRAFRKLEKQT